MIPAGGAVLVESHHSYGSAGDPSWRTMLESILVMTASALC